MSIISAIIPALLLLDLVWWFSADRLLRKAGFKGRVRILHSLFFGFQLASLLAVIASRQSELWDHLPKVVTTAVYLWHLLILPLLLPLLAVGAIVALLCWVIGKIRTRKPRETADAQTDGAGMSRRAFLAATAAFTPQLFTVGLTAIALRQLEQFRVRRMTIAVRGLPAALDGLTIAHVSDMHAGRFTRSAILREMIGAVNDLRSELVLVTGDLINGALHELPEGIDAVRRLDARSGVYMIEGNHDLFQGREAFESRVKASGIRLLVNETEQLTVRGHPLQLLGLRWGRPSFRPYQRSGDAAIASFIRGIAGAARPGGFPHSARAPSPCLRPRRGRATAPDPFRPHPWRPVNAERGDRFRPADVSLLVGTLHARRQSPHRLQRRRQLVSLENESPGGNHSPHSPARLSINPECTAGRHVEVGCP